MTWDFATHTHTLKFENGSYKLDWTEVDIKYLLKEGYEPMQVMQVDTNFIFFFKRPSKPNEK